MRRMGWKKKSLLTGLVLCLLLTCASAFAGEVDFFTLSIDALDLTRLNNNEYVSLNLSSSMPGLRIIKQVSQSSELAQPVRLTLVRMDTQVLLVDKDYGYQSKQFDSGVIYLPYSSSYITPYLVTLYAGDMVYAIPYMHRQPRLTSNTGCSYGIRLRDLNPEMTSDWLMGTILDLDALRLSGTQTVNLCASDYYIIGYAKITMENEYISIQPFFNTEANVEVHGLSVYVINDASALCSDPQLINHPVYTVNQKIPVENLPSVMLYMPMLLSYDPVKLNSFDYNLNHPELIHQLNLWNGSSNPDSIPETPSSGFVWTEETEFDSVFAPHDDEIEWHIPQDDIILEDIAFPNE